MKFLYLILCPWICSSVSWLTVYENLNRVWTRRHWNIHRDVEQGAKISWFKGTEIIQSLFPYHCGMMLEINIKRYLKTHIFSSAMWHLPREIFDLAIESLDKIGRLIEHSRCLQRSKHLNEKLIIKILLKSHVFEN